MRYKDNVKIFKRDGIRTAKAKLYGHVALTPCGKTYEIGSGLHIRDFRDMNEAIAFCEQIQKKTEHITVPTSEGHGERFLVNPDVMRAIQEAMGYLDTLKMRI